MTRKPLSDHPSVIGPGQTVEHLIHPCRRRIPKGLSFTIDSGFPLPELEQTLQGGQTFRVPVRWFPRSSAVRATRATGLLAAGRTTRSQQGSDRYNPERPACKHALIGLLIPNSILKPNKGLQRAIGIRKLLAVRRRSLIFYGSHICIPAGRVSFREGRRRNLRWKDWWGPARNHRLLSSNDLLAGGKGWLTAYFDVPFPGEQK